MLWLLPRGPHRRQARLYQPCRLPCGAYQSDAIWRVRARSWGYNRAQNRYRYCVCLYLRCRGYVLATTVRGSLNRETFQSFWLSPVTLQLLNFYSLYQKTRNIKKCFYARCLLYKRLQRYNNFSKKANTFRFFCFVCRKFGIVQHWCNFVWS